MTAGTAILETFYRAAGQFVPLAELERVLRRPTTGVTAEIAELQGLGYRIEVHPHLGYRLVVMPDRLIADDINARLESLGVKWKPRVIGSEILVFEQTSSTNDVVARMAESQRGEGLVAFAESQTKGRGRRGRAWASPRGKGLWFSVLLRPNLPLSSAPRITVAASVAVARAIRKACELDARIKWPNDVTVNGKKLAGILVETSGCPERSDNGIGGTGVPAPTGVASPARTCASGYRGMVAFTVTRRNLPHWQDPGRLYFVTFRVRSGAVLNEQMRNIVLEACRHWHGRKYHLYAISVMPDHVHLLLWPRPIESDTRCTDAEKGVHSLSEILHGIKSFTAHQIQRQCGWKGSVWMEESFDRIVRDDAEFMEKWNYIAQNAVKKNLAVAAEDYRWFWCAPETLGAEPERGAQAGTPVPPRQDRVEQCIILGIGINVNCAAADFPAGVAEIATSLQIETGRTHDRAALATAVLRALDEYYATAQTDFDSIIAEWAQLCTTLGKQIVVTMGKRRIEGHAQALDGDGALLLRKDNGQIERILGGDLTVERA
jgi:biotin-(acetyl-CoA carboxylase) ligase/REP element-mobilizing transposase RayT/biotin operon repressor